MMRWTRSLFLVALPCLVWAGPASADEGPEVIKDPAQARRRAAYLMRQVVVEHDGRLIGPGGKEPSARLVLDEVVRACPDTAEAAVARKALKILDAPLPAGNGKPLSLAALAVRGEVRLTELQQARQTGNEGNVFLVRVAQGREQQSWLGKQAEGIAQVVSAQGSTTILYAGAGRQARKVEATFEDGAAAAGLTRGLVIRLRGTLTRFDGGTFVLDDCEINPKK
jgi:hypothetical protein